MKRMLIAAFILAFLGSVSFAADPYSFSRDLRKGNNYDKPKASAVFSDEGVRITVKPANFLWGHFFDVPDSTRYLNFWDISVYVNDSNGAFFGIGIGHEKAGINFYVNSSGKYRIGSWGSNNTTRLKEGTSPPLSFPIKVGLKYDISKSEVIALVNDVPLVTVRPQDFSNMPQLTTIKIVELETKTDWGKSNGWAVFKDITINAFNENREIASIQSNGQTEESYIETKSSKSNDFSLGVNGIKWKDDISKYKNEMKIVKKMGDETILYARSDYLDLGGVKLNVIYDFTNGKFEGVIGNGKKNDFDKIKKYFTELYGPVLINGEQYTWVSKDNIGIVLNEKGTVYIIDQNR